jgi:hypothetical protein
LGLFAILNTALELPLGGDNEVLIEWISMGQDSDALPPPVITERTAVLEATTYILLLQLRHVFLSGGSPPKRTRAA